jgi:type VII secretion protein EccB
MPSRQDQLHSYQFSVQRVVAALVMRETDPAQSPVRRVAGATMAGAIFATLALAAAAGYGLFAGGTGDWRKEGQVIIEKESGARYVYYKGDGKLHPAVNYASAVLIADAAKPDVVTMSRSSLGKAPRGAPMGIAGAPDSLPDAKNLVKPPWTLCSQPPEASGAGASGAAGKPQSTLLIGGAVRDGRALVPVGATTAADGLLLSTPDGKKYLVYNNHRYQIAQPDIVLRAFAWSTQRILPVSPALINALPAAPDVKLLPVVARGGKSPALPGAKTGQVYTIRNAGGEVQHAVALADGLADITEAQADLLAFDPDTPASPTGEGTLLQPAEYDTATRSKNGLTAAPPFAKPPGIREPIAQVCVSIPDASGVSDVWLDPKVPDSRAATVTASRTTIGGVLADRIVVAPGHGALVEALASPGAANGTLSLVADLGIRYPLASRDLVSKLGYEGVAPLRMPAELVALLPVGPALDPAAAQQNAGS